MTRATIGNNTAANGVSDYSKEIPTPRVQPPAEYYSQIVEENV